jgi:hypothetical protein
MAENTSNYEQKDLSSDGDSTSGSQEQIPSRAGEVASSEKEMQESAQSGDTGKPAGLDRLAHSRKKLPPVDRTKLDVEACRDMAAKVVSEQESRLREQLESQPSEPMKPFQVIDKYRLASPCSSVWDKMTGTGCVRFCEQCKSQVYDFSKMEMPEAEKLIFQRENKEKFILFKRKDGKFLTADCPVGVRWKRTVLLASLGGLLLVAGFFCLLASQPPPTRNVTTGEPVPFSQDTGRVDLNGVPNYKGKQLKLYSYKRPAESAPVIIDNPNQGSEINEQTSMPAAAPLVPTQSPADGQAPAATQAAPALAPAIQGDSSRQAMPAAHSSASTQSPAGGQVSGTTATDDRAFSGVGTLGGQVLTPQQTQQPGIWQSPAK